MSPEERIKELNKKLNRILDLAEYIVSISFDDRQTNVTIQEKVLAKNIIRIIVEE